MCEPHKGHSSALHILPIMVHSLENKAPSIATGVDNRGQMSHFLMGCMNLQVMEIASTVNQLSRNLQVLEYEDKVFREECGI